MSGHAGESVTATEREPVLCEGVTSRRYLPPCVNCGAAIHTVHQGGQWMWVHFSWDADEHCGEAVPPDIRSAWATCAKCGVKVPTVLTVDDVCEGCQREADGAQGR